MNRRLTVALAAAGAALVVACGHATYEHRPAAAPEPETSAGALDEPGTEPARQESLPAETQTVDVQAQLARAVTELEELLRPIQLGCSSAQPHVEAICRIAERICDLVDRQPSATDDPEECSKARAQCADAQRRYSERCD